MTAGGYDDIARYELGDAMATIDRYDGPFDVVLIDHQKSTYADAFEAVRSDVPVGGVVVADNAITAGVIEFDALLDWAEGGTPTDTTEHTRASSTTSRRCGPIRPSRRSSCPSARHRGELSRRVVGRLAVEHLFVGLFGRRRGPVLPEAEENRRSGGGEQRRHVIAVSPTTVTRAVPVGSSRRSRGQRRAPRRRPETRATAPTR